MVIFFSSFNNRIIRTTLWMRQHLLQKTW